MGDDVVELAEVRPGVEDVAVFDTYVGQAGGGDHRLADGDFALRVIEADEFAAGKRFGHRDQVLARRAADVQHAAVSGWRWIEAEKVGHGGKAVGVAEHLRRPVVGHFVVRVGHMGLSLRHPAG